MLQDFSGERLRGLRKRSRLTQRQVVKLAGVSEAAICYLEQGKRKPQSSTLDKLLGLYAMRIQMIKNQEAIFQEKPNVRNIDS
jgi:transcriptional regulator with XRE-family HTH domain